MLFAVFLPIDEVKYFCSASVPAALDGMMRSQFDGGRAVEGAQLVLLLAWSWLHCAVLRPLRDILSSALIAGRYGVPKSADFFRQ